jgi:hypothetical protein
MCVFNCVVSHTLQRFDYMVSRFCKNSRRKATTLRRKNYLFSSLLYVLASSQKNFLLTVSVWQFLHLLILCLMF